MTKKLTLSLDSEIVEFAHDFSKRAKKPISKMIEDYFIGLKASSAKSLPGDLDELYGVFEGILAPDKKELRKLVYEKYNR